MGRKFEILVRDLERFLAHTPIQVRSPEYVIGRKSQERLEIDVSLRARIGSRSVFVMIECRERAGKQGVDWIWHLAGKRADVGATHVVAVARAGFTAKAHRLAASEGIELRTLSEVGPADALSWTGVRVDVCALDIVVHDAFFDLRKSEPGGTAAVVIRPGNRLPDLICPNGTRRSLLDVFALDIATSRGRSVAHNGVPWHGTVEMTTDQNAAGYRVETDRGPVDVVAVRLRISVSRRGIPDRAPEMNFGYFDERHRIGRMSATTYDHEGIPMMISTYSSEDGHTAGFGLLHFGAEGTLEIALP